MSNTGPTDPPLLNALIEPLVIAHPGDDHLAVGIDRHGGAVLVGLGFVIDPGDLNRAEFADKAEPAGEDAGALDLGRGGVFVRAGPDNRDPTQFVNAGCSSLRKKPRYLTVGDPCVLPAANA